MNARPDNIETATDTPVPAPAPQATDAETTARPPRGRRRALMISVPLLLALAGAGAWLFGGRYISTDNAYIHQPMTTISADVSGRVSDVLVTENQQITAGTPLFRLDPTDYEIALATADAQLASARLAVEQQRATYQTAQAQLQASQNIEDVKADTLPSVRAALAARQSAERHLEQTNITAATGGTVSQIESLNVGAFLAAGTGIAKLVDNSQTWVEANFKETQIADLTPGQPVTIEVDAYPGMELHGTVDSFASATGSQFSLIPAQNATGNWVKVVQRVPVRIQITDTPDRPLRDGMSVSVSVDTGHNRLEGLK